MKLTLVQMALHLAGIKPLSDPMFTMSHTHAYTYVDTREEWNNQQPKKNSVAQGWRRLDQSDLIAAIVGLTELLHWLFINLADFYYE